MKTKIYFGLENFDSEMFYEFYELKIEKKNIKREVQSKETMEKKTSLFIHNLVSRQVNSYNDVARLNAEVLRQVFGGEYREILDYLIESNIVKVVEEAKIGEQSRSYRVVDLEKNIRCEKRPYFYPYRIYVNRLEQEVQKIEKNAEEKAQKSLGESIYKKYLSSLNKVKINTIKAQEYIDLRFMDSVRESKYYYLNVLERYKEKKRYINVPNKKAKDDRIYHIVTNTPRELKYFLNIKYQVDIHNSHPLLFNSLLYDKYEIPQNIRYILSNTIIDIYNNYNNNYNYLSIICNILRDKGIDNFEVKKIEYMPFDVLRYIYLTSTGQFWDVILEECKGNVGGYELIRQDFKGILFGQVFYSKKSESEIDYRAYEYAEKFKKEFPNVYSHILSYRKGDDKAQLSHKLMALESKLFRAALKRLFEMNFEVVSIHDAIVVLDTQANANCSSEMVKGILEDVYKEKEGLVCDCSIDIYGKEAMESFLESERELRTLGDEYISCLRKDESKKGLVKDYEEGKSEIIWKDKKKKEVMLHPKDTKKLMYKKNNYANKPKPCLDVKECFITAIYNSDGTLIESYTKTA